MEICPAWPTPTKKHYRRLLGIVGSCVTSLLAVHLLGGCSSEAAPNNYVDCQQQPDGVAKGTIDTMGNSILNIGNAVTNPDDSEPTWKEKIILQALGDGTFAVTVDGFGPVLHQSDIANDPAPSPILTNASSGSQLTLTASSAESSSTTAPVTATYAC